MTVRIGVLALSFAVLIFAFVADSTHAMTDAECAAKIPGSRTATANDAVTKQPSSGIKVGDCYRPTDAGVTSTAAQAREYLNSLPKKAINNSNCAPPNQKNIVALNDTFAICAARFFQAYTKQYGQVTITSAFRDDTPGSGPDGKKSANQCAGGVKGSNHAKGIAMDVYPNNGNWQQLWTFASNNPQFGVCFPFQNNPIRGYPNGDRPHMVLAGSGGGEAARCAAQKVTAPCSGTSFDPNNVRPASSGPVASGGSAGAPSSGFTNALRQALGMQQQPPPPPPMPSQPLQQQQSPLGAFNPAPISQPTPVSQQIGSTPITSGTGGTPSVSDQLLSIINAPTSSSATSTATGTSAPIVITGASAGTVVVTTYSSATPQYGSGSLQPVGEQTFSSNDINQQEPLSAYYGDPRFQEILSSLRGALTFLSHYLTPFRNRPLESHE